MNDQQAAEYMACIESAMQAARWAIPVDLAIAAHAKALAFDLEVDADFEISGDHRPRIGRRRLGLDDVAQYREDEGLPPSPLWLWIRRLARRRER